MQNYSLIDNKWTCSECQRQFNSRQAVTSHIYRSHTNPGAAFGGHRKGAPAWNKGLTKDTDPRVERNARSVSASTKGKPGRPHSDKTKQLLSKKMSVCNKGGRAKWYSVAGQKVQGTWERDAATKLEELGVKWIKLKTNKDTLEYSMDGKIRSYTPDFYLPEYDVFLEIKGYWWGRDKEKMETVLKTHPDKKIVIVEKEKFLRLMEGELVW